MSSVLTPYYKEDVLYSEEELNKENEDGITILFYLQRIYPGKLLSGAFVCIYNKFKVY